MIDYRQGDVLDQLAQMKAEGVKVRTCVTSPPYWGLRDYGASGQIGLEKTPDEYVAKMVQVFRAVRDVLAEDGTLWLNLGDSYSGTGGQGHQAGNLVPSGFQQKSTAARAGSLSQFNPDRGIAGGASKHRVTDTGLKNKDLIGIPWRVAFALQADGWYLRSDIIWHKPNPMPESVRDRPTKAHEYIFLLSKSPKYFYDADAVREPLSETTAKDPRMNDMGRTYSGKGRGAYGESGKANGQMQAWSLNPNGRNRRSVWTVTTKPYKGAHFATFPPDLIEPCILAGTSAKGQCPQCGKAWERVTERGEFIKFENGLGNGSLNKDLQIHARGESSAFRTGGTFERNTTGWRATCSCNLEPVPDLVLDPFGGSGTTAEVAIKHGRRAILIELNPQYVELQRARLAKYETAQTAPLFEV